MISQELARGKTDLVAMVQQGEDSQSINIVIVQSHTESFMCPPPLCPWINGVCMMPSEMAPQTNCQVITHVENIVMTLPPPPLTSSPLVGL